MHSAEGESSIGAMTENDPTDESRPAPNVMDIYRELRKSRYGDEEISLQVQLDLFTEAREEFLEGAQALLRTDAVEAGDTP